MQKQQGFTLIELVVVIIILGILAVVAAPKFINLQGDARVSTLQGVKAAIQGSNTLVYSKAVIAGEEKKGLNTERGSVDIGSSSPVSTRFGYIEGDAAQLLLAVELSASDWSVTGTGGKVRIQQVGAPDTCYLDYNEAASAGALPTFTTDIEDPNDSTKKLPMPAASDC
ncbi:type II secretion system protein [Shewanella intestini]|uniref:Prepilin-type N-terminal cleavage/methylation domain-containing protein n=1 Tax=Shewanella intestini TaxID=2017544 RepID=A0ABS5I5S0_9GAMM|nr:MULTISPECIES: prepilin-type N-terminal cleavage/methylation domain-containing protein [Shewanella]MBR9729059.1 prepilin-type N-terminal cleavage/methylation domain-containing protein [Shewanella intestini]MRG37135.1 prepilin-type N-terminal cleavage/methylation domain-containing protein [Shewanella sp. XMDDZSB0408]